MQPSAISTTAQILVTTLAPSRWLPETCRALFSKRTNYSYIKSELPTAPTAPPVLECCSDVQATSSGIYPQAVLRQRLLWLVSRPVLLTLRPCPSRSAAMPRDTHHAQAHQKIISPRGLESKPYSLHASSLGVTGGKGRQGPARACCGRLRGTQRVWISGSFRQQNSPRATGCAGRQGPVVTFVDMAVLHGGRHNGFGFQEVSGNNKTARRGCAERRAPAKKTARNCPGNGPVCAIPR